MPSAGPSTLSDRCRCADAAGVAETEDEPMCNADCWLLSLLCGHGIPNLEAAAKFVCHGAGALEFGRAWEQSNC